MAKKRKRTGNRTRLQGVTLCISTALVLVLLGLVAFSTLTARNLSAYMKENLVVTMMLEQNVTDPEAQQLCRTLQQKQYINNIKYITKEQALKEGIRDLGTDPREFVDQNPFLGSIDVTLKADYANNDSLKWITSELKNYTGVTSVDYQKGLVEEVNKNLAKFNLIFLVLAALLTFISFSLINNTVRLGIYARRFSIHTMKLVGASWGFIRRPFILRFVGIGLLAALLAILVLGGVVYSLYRWEPDIVTVVTPLDLGITGAVVVLFGLIITSLCANISVNKFLRMKAGELYKI